MTLIAQMGALFLQGAAVVPETTLVPSVATGPGWYTIFTEIAGVATSIVFFALMVILIPAVAKFRKTATKFAQVLEHIERSIDPVTKHATRIADNVDYVTTAVRADVQELRRTLHDANAGLREAIDASERRLHELGALLRVVQEEAEHAFVSTAATLRGVQAGAATFREGGAQPARDEEMDVMEEDRLEVVDELVVLDDDDELVVLDDDLDAATGAAEDTDDGYDYGPAFERAEPRIKRSRHGDAS